MGAFLREQDLQAISAGITSVLEREGVNVEVKDGWAGNLKCFKKECLKYYDEEETYDLLIDAFCHFESNVRKYRERMREGVGYINAVLRNCVILSSLNYHKYKEREQFVKGVFYEQALNRQVRKEGLEEEVFLLEILRKLEELGERSKELVVRIMEGEKAVEIARDWKVSEAAVSKRLKEVRERIG